MNNEDLAKDLYSDDNTALVDNVGVTAAANDAVIGASSGAKIQTAADLFGNIEQEE